MIKGITVTLYEKKETGTDPFGHPVYEEMPVDVENVLVAPSTTTEVLDVLNITGKKAVYDIAIPKGDDHTWEDCRVDFFGESWRVFGLPKIASASETEAYVAQTRAVVKVCGDDGNNGLLKAVGKHGGKNR